MKLEQILQELTRIYLPSLSYPHTSTTSIRLFHGHHELTALDLDILSLDPRLDIKAQCEFIRAQIQAMHFGINPAEEDSEEPSRSHLTLNKSYTDARRLSRPTRYLDGHIAISDETYTYLKSPYDTNNTKFSMFLRLALLQTIALNPEHNHPFITFPLACEFDIQHQECTSKFPLRKGQTLQEFLKSSTPSYQQWLNILISLYLILEQLTYLGLCFTSISFRDLQISSDTGYLKLINWETFRTTSDNTEPSLMGFFGAINYLTILTHITEKLSHSSNLSSQEHASLLSLTLNVIEVLRNNHIRFENNRHPNPEELTTLNDEVLRAFQTSLNMPTFKEPLSQIFHNVDIPYAQLQRIFNALIFTPNLSEMATRIDTAIEIGFREFIELLLITNTIEPDQVNERGETLLFRICRFTQKSSYEVLDALLTDKFKAKVNPNAPDNFGNTPLIADILNPYNPGSNLIKLLNMGANPNLTNHKGDSPLHIACALPPSGDSISLYVSDPSSIIEVIKAAEKCSADPLSAQTNIPSSEAISITQTLLAYGANPLLPNHQHLTPIDIANQSGFMNLATVLREKPSRAFEEC